MKFLNPVESVKPGKRAFTLIELLVVIAIIAILASILFPVFGRARENARRSSCQSNMKQVALGVTQYLQDYDEKFPIKQYAYTDPTSFTWVNAVQPYVKTYGIFRCASDKVDPFGIWGSNPGKGYANWNRWPSYGYNYQYLTPNGCRIVNGDYDWQPINSAKIQQPSAMVLATEIKHVGDSTGYYTSYTAEAPGTGGPGEPDECQYSNTGWGTGNYKDTGALNYPITYTGDVDARHFDGVNVAFVDGHVKWMTIGRLAQGTNWRVGIANTAVDVTDLNQYLWDYR